MSGRRLFYLMCIIVGLCSFLILYNVKESQNKTVTINHRIMEEQAMIEGSVPANIKKWKFYVIGDESRELYKDIFSNVCNILDDIQISWETVEQITEKELEDTSAVLIFCDDVINKYVDLRQLASFVENGGKVIAAAGLAEGYEDIYLQPVFGIVEKTIKENYNDFYFHESILPLQSEEMSYAGYNMSTWITLRNEANVLVEEVDKNVPIIYTYPFGHGESLVFNATFLSDNRCAGILLGSLGEFIEPFVYPVLGTKSIFLDNFPMVTYVNDPVCMKLYGRTTEAFVRDVVWPVFQNIAVSNDVSFTSSVLTVSNEEVFPKINNELFKTLGKSALQFNGEFIYAANIMPTIETDFSDEELLVNNTFINGFEDIFTNYHISGLAMMSDGDVNEIRETLDKEVISIRGKLDDKSKRFLYTGDYFMFPEATSGFIGSEGDWLDVKSVLAAYGMISHTFDVNNLISANEDEAIWDRDKVLLGEFEKDILQKTKFLKTATLSETQYAVKSYLEMDYAYEYTEDKICLYADNFVQGQAFYVRTKKDIIEISGAECEKISDGYYMVRMQMPEAVLILGEE